MSLLRTQGLKKHFGETRAVDGVDFTVNEGEFLSLVGTNGAGKTTLVNLISAFLLPDSGRIFIGGNCPQLPDRQPVRRTFGFRQCRAVDLLA